MAVSHTLAFGEFRIDLHDERLWHGEEPVPLTNRAFGVLQYLVEHPAHLVTKDALVESVWPRTHVTDAALAVCVAELRRALHDDAKAPRYIETVRGRGYRFIPSIGNRASPAAPSASVVPQSPQTRLTGRKAELDQLQSCLATALQGRRQIVFVSGEAGIGKTTLIDAFVESVATTPGLRIGRGQGVEQYGAGEAYMPVLESFSRLCREAGGDGVARTLRQYAPSWLLQMPALLNEDGLTGLQRSAGDVTRARMLRELAEAVEVLAEEIPLLLIFEDLHWGDVSTLEWLAYVARRRDTACLLILGTYRPVEAIVRDHPLRRIVHDLMRQQQCTELALDYLSEDDVADYLSQRVNGAQVPNGLASLISQRSGGNPLFMVVLIETLVNQGAISIEGGEWLLHIALAAIAEDVPENLRQLIDQQIEQLDPELQTLLETASVVGTQFSVAALAADTDLYMEIAEAHLAKLARRGQFVQSVGTAEWPGGSRSSEYAFVHALYQQVLYERVPAARRQRLHRRIGTCLEDGHGDSVDRIAAELSAHFVAGNDAARAVRYLALASENALQHGGHQEAVAHVTRALDIVRKLPENGDRDETELRLQYGLGGALVAARGFAWPQTGEAFARARELCARVGNTSQVSTVFHGVCLYHLDRGELRIAHEIATEALRFARHENDATALMLGHRLVGTCLYFLGEFTTARDHLQQALDLYEASAHRPLMFVCAVDVQVAILCWLSRVLLMLGYPEQADAHRRHALDWSNALAHPHTLAFALRDACFIPQFYGEADQVRPYAGQLIALATHHGFAFELAEANIHAGWARAVAGEAEQGIAQMRAGLADYRATGSVFQLPYFYGLLADVCVSANDCPAALDALDEAFDQCQATQEMWLASELLRLRAELYSIDPNGNVEQAEQAFRDALDMARQQQARSLELRTALGLARRWRGQGNVASANELLADLCGWFSEDSAHLKQARAELALY